MILYPYTIVSRMKREANICSEKAILRLTTFNLNDRNSLLIFGTYYITRKIRRINRILDKFHGSKSFKHVTKFTKLYSSFPNLCNATFCICRQLEALLLEGTATVPLRRLGQEVEFAQ